MSSDTKEEHTQRCVACREAIYPSAKICPHCRTAQAASPWKPLLKVMAVVGAISTVATLIIATSQITSLAKSVAEGRKAAKQLVSAAELLWEKGDRHSAMQLLQESQSINPGGTSAGDLQAKIGMEEVRRLYREGDHPLAEATLNYDRQDRPGYLFLTTVDSDTLNEFLDQSKIRQVLARQAANSTGTREARSLAHLAWLEMNLNDEPRLNIDQLFADAEQADGNDVFVLTMHAAWLASQRQPFEDESERRLAEANERFAKALKLASQPKVREALDDQDLNLTAWIRALQLEALPAVDAMAALIEARTSGEEISAVGTLGLTRRTFIMLSGWGGSPYPERVKEIEEQLVSHIDTEPLIEFANWMAAVHFGCDQEGHCEQDDHESAQILYAIGRLHELSHHNEAAIRYYQFAQAIGGSGWWSESIENGLDRLQMASIE